MPTESGMKEETTALFEFYGRCRVLNFQGDFKETDTILSMLTVTAFGVNINIPTILI